MHYIYGMDLIEKFTRSMRLRQLYYGYSAERVSFFFGVVVVVGSAAC